MLDGLADRDAEGLGDLIARVKTLLQQPNQGLGLVVLEESAAQERGEGADDVAFGDLVPADVMGVATWLDLPNDGEGVAEPSVGDRLEVDKRRGAAVGGRAGSTQATTQL